MFDDEGPQMPGAVAALAAAVDGYVPALADCEGAALPEQLVALRGLIGRLEGAFREGLARHDSSGQVTDRGMRVSTTSWLHSQTGTSFPAGRRQLHTARVLAKVLPLTAAELRAGTLTVDQVDIICRAVGATKITRTAAAAQEAELLAAVRPVPVHQLPAVMRQWQLVVDPEHADREDDHAHEDRWLQASATFQGTVAINGMLDAEGGAAVLTALEALCAPIGTDDDRSKATRRADALIQLARHSLDDRTLPDVSGERPHVTVTVDLGTLTGRSITPADLDHIGPTRAEAARRIACDAGIVTVLTLGRSEILDVGRRTRTISPALRRALHVRDRGCAFDGCVAPVRWTDGHHIRHWADGGPTDLNNLILLCPVHHRGVHEHGWTITRDNGEWIFRPPDPLPARPHDPDPDLAWDPDPYRRRRSRRRVA